MPADRDIDPLIADIRFFASTLEGWSAAHAERVVLPCPSLEIDPYREIAPHLDVTSARARALHALATKAARVVVTSVAAIAARVSSVERMRDAAVVLQSDVDVDLSTLADRLVDAGFTRADPVDQHGEFCIRGGLVDVFPPGEAQPVRVEFLGDTIETLRRYDAQTQRSIETIDHVLLLPLRDVLPEAGGGAAQGADDVGVEAVDRGGSILDYATDAGARLFVVEHADVIQHGEALEASLASSYAEATRRGRRVLAPEAIAVPWNELADALATATRLDRLAVDEADRPVRAIACQSVTRHHGRVDQWVAELRKAREAGETTLFVAESAGRAERTIELLREYDVLALPVDAAEVTRAAVVLVTTGAITAGVRLADARLTLVAESDVFDDERVRRDRASAAGGPSAGTRRTFFSDFRDLKVGDHVVHVDHGIGRFVGLKKLAVGADAQEFMELRYADDNKLFVPVEHLDLVQKYSGGGNPQLDRLGGTTWEKAKTRVKKAMRDMADELLKLYATRKAVPGHAFGADTHWQEEFEQAFEYELTSDQKVAIADIKNDMESPTPMDRLLCGDVGYGKTEVAMRAAFKAVMDGRQVAVLAPTTVLAFQHLRTLQSRFAAFPVKVDMVSRFRSKAGAEGHAGQPGGRQAGHHRRDAPPALEGRDLPRPRAARRRRGAALRRRPQGAHQADAPQGRRADDERDADPAHAQHVAGRHPRHVGDRDAAARPPGDPDQRRGLRPEGDRRRGAARAGARRPGLPGAQPRRVDLLDRRAGAAAGPGSEDHRSGTARWARTSSRR